MRKLFTSCSVRGMINLCQNQPNSIGTIPPHSPIQQNLKESVENFHCLKSDILSVFWPLIQIALNFYQNRKILQHLNKKTVRESRKQNVRFETMKIFIYEMLLLYHSNLFRIRQRTKQIIEGWGGGIKENSGL